MEVPNPHFAALIEFKNFYVTFYGSGCVDGEIDTFQAGFKFRAFVLLDWLPIQTREPSAFIDAGLNLHVFLFFWISYCQKEASQSLLSIANKRRICVYFPKALVLSEENKLGQVLNSALRFHFLDYATFAPKNEFIKKKR